MTSNTEAAEIFRSVADLLDLLGEKFKPEAYRRAARSIESLTEDLSAVAARGELRAIPGVGEAIAEKIEEYLRTGSLGYYERLKREIPPGVVEFMRLPGLGPKTARRFWVELGVEGPNELKDAIAAGRLDGVKGFGEKKIEQVRAALSAATPDAAGGRRPIEEVYPIARALVEALREKSGADRVEVAGSFRRARETVGDLDILVTSRAPARAFETFTAHPLVGEVKMRGDTKETVVLKGGLQVDLRVVEPSAFGAALQYFTGSKDHNVRLRSLARDRGLKVNEYGVFRAEERVAGATEEDVYASLGLAWIPPELREDRGEVEAAAQGTLPSLVGEGDLRGDLHTHLPPDAGPDAVDRIVTEARRRRLSYVGVVTAGVQPDGRVWTLPTVTLEQVAKLSAASVLFLRAVEAGPGPLPKELESIPCDVRIVRPTPSVTLPRDPEGKSVRADLFAHVGPTVGSDAGALGEWVERARRASAAIEVGPGPERLDSTAARRAREAGVALHLATGLGGPSDDPTGAVALGFARRAGAPASDVVNARDRPGAKGPGSGSRRGPKR